MTRLLIVGIGAHRELALRTFLRGDVELAAVDSLASPYLRLADQALGVMDVRDPDQALPAALRVAADFRPEAVLTFMDPCLPVVGAIVEMHGLRGIRAEAALAAHRKDRMRAVLASHGVPVPAFSVVSSPASAASAAAAIGYPVCVKPTNRAGSIGVSKVSSPVQLVAAFEEAWSSRLFGAGAVLVEEWQVGDEVSVESVTSDDRTSVVCVTRKLVSAPPTCFEVGHTVPLRRHDEKRLEEVVAAAVRALGIDHAVTHTELMLTRQGPVVIEVNARPAGDLVPDLVRLASGFDLYRAQLDVALGRAPHDKPCWKRGASIRFLCGGAGRLQDVPNLTEVQGLPGVEEVVVEVQPGHELGRVTSSLGRRGYVVAVAATAEMAERTAARAAEELVLATSTRKTRRR